MEAKMGFFDDVVPGGNIAEPLMIALGTLLVGKMIRGSSAPTQATTPTTGGVSQPQQGGGLQGGLRGLLDSLSNAGHGDAVASWVGPGENTPIQPDKLGSALGQITVSDLARNAGMSEPELLTQLSRILPAVVDKLTPNGRIPNEAELRTALGQ
jgi:uncharacterized protein YidB (DUF937 family)